MTQNEKYTSMTTSRFFAGVGPAGALGVLKSIATIFSEPERKYCVSLKVYDCPAILALINQKGEVNRFINPQFRHLSF